MKGAVVLVVCFLVASCVEASNRNIFLRSKTLDTTGTPDFFSSESQQKHVRSVPSSSTKWLLHLKGPITRKIKAEVQGYLGVNLGQYFPQNTFMITAAAELAERAKDAPHVLWIGAYLPEYKVSDLLQTSLEPGQFEENLIRIHLDETHAEERTLLALAWTRALKSQNIDVIFEIVGQTDMIVNTTSVEQTTSWLAEQHETIWLEPVPIFRPAIQWSTRLTQGGPFNLTEQPLLHKYNLKGFDQQIAVGDTNLNRDSCFFTGANVNLDCTFLPGQNCQASPAHDHGTHVAGSLIGRPAAPLNNHTGFAPAASLYHIALPYAVDTTNPEGVVITPPRSLFDYFQAASTSNARVVLSSFSSQSTGYSLSDREVDDFVSSISGMYMLLIFPAGNNGAKGPGNIGAPGSSKNGLTVGSTQNHIGALRKANPDNAVVNDAKYAELFGESILATHSSRGPTADRRIKPDVVAPGEAIFSASAAGCDPQSGATISMTGTSMAAAAVAGAAALIRDYFAQSFYGLTGAVSSGGYLNPTSVMMKAVIINSGVPLVGVQGEGSLGEFSKFLYFSGTPDGYQGFGRVDLSKVLHLNGTGSKPFFLETNITKAVATGQSENYCFKATTGSKVKATLVWADPPASASTSVALVNNLDLIVVDILTGREYRSNGWERFDDINNVEQVDFVVPAENSGNFAAYVHGTNVPVNSPQKYSLVISGGIDIDPAAPTCSGGVCPNLCSGRGTCNNGKCRCNEGFFGVDCSLSVCPNNCGNKDPSVRRGSCNFETHTCICDPRFTGADCSEAKKGLETIVVTTDTGVSTPVVAGAICGAVFGGILLGILVGFFLAVRTLENQRKKRREQLLRQGK